MVRLRLTTEISQLLHKVIDVPVACRAGLSHPCRGAEVASHGPDFLSAHRVPLLDMVIDDPIAQVVQFDVFVGLFGGPRYFTNFSSSIR